MKIQSSRDDQILSEEKKKHLSEKREERLSKGRVKIKSIEDITDYCQDSITMDVIYNKRIVSVNFKYLDLIKKGVLGQVFTPNKKLYTDRAMLNPNDTPDNVIEGNVECIVINL